jgi:hypothetical protein
MKRTTILVVCLSVLLATGCSGSGANTGAGSAPTTAPAASPGTAESPAAAVPSTPTAPDAGGGNPVSGRCHTSDLGIKPGTGEAAAGTQYLALVFTNTSGRTCTLYGYPGVSWVAGDQGSQVGDAFQRGGDDKKATATLEPGQAAHATLQMPNAGNYDEARCKPMSVRGLRVYPPDETAAVFVTLPSKECSAKGVNVDTVWAISSGTHLDPQ